VHHFLWRFARDSQSGGHLFVACHEVSKVWHALSMEQNR
jgi:hypothetical protein